MAKPGPAAGFDAIRHPQKRALLLAYSESRQLRPSYEAAGISRPLHYHWLKTDPDYQAAFAEAKEQAADVLEDEAVRRATLTTQGASDTLLIFLLKGARPDIYRDHVHLETDITIRVESALQQGLSRLEVLRAPDRLAS